VSPKTYRQKNLGQLIDTSKEKDSKSLLKIDRADSQSLNVKLQLFPAYTVIFARHQNGYNKEIGKAWERLMRWAFAHNLLSGGFRTFGIPLDSPEITPSGKCRYLACLVIDPACKENLKLPGYLSYMDIPGGLYAISRFEGAESGISNAYNELYGNWLPTSGFEPADSPALEIYDNSNKERSKGKFKFEICLPVTAV
jgi:AraC family transcriptional regulator